MSAETIKNNNNQTYDFRIVKWLLGFGRPYWHFFILALVFMILTAGLELLIPYIIKEAVDEYIYPSWRIVDFSEQSGAFKQKLLAQYPSAFDKTEHANKYLVYVSKLGRIDRTDLEKLGIVSDEKILAIDITAMAKEDKSAVSRIIDENSEEFQRAENLFYITSSSLNTFPTDDIKTLRHSDLGNIKRLGVYIFLVLIAIYIFSSSFTILLQYSGQKIMHNLRSEVFAHLLTLPQRFYDTNPIGRLSTRVTNDVNAINEMYTSVLVQFVKDLLVIIGVFIIMFKLNRNLTFLIMVLTLFFAFFGVLFRMRLRRAYRNVRKSIAMLNAFVQESVRGITLLKLYNREEQNFGRFKLVSDENFQANMQQVFAFATFRPIIEFISVFAVALILWNGGLSVLSLELTLGALLAYLAYIRMLFAPILELAERYNIFQSAIAASENLYELHTATPESLEGEDGLDFKGKIEFQNVWFAYTGGDWVLRDVSFTASPGEQVALVGLTGSGKTTIVNLLLRLYDAQKGQILIDGVPIEKLNPKFLRSQITTVFQDLFLFGKSISEDGTAARNEMELALQEDGIQDRFLKMDGSNLSSGENQLASLAEAFSRTAPILILDEATSHVDATLERKIQGIVKSGAEERTTLVIAHRLSNVKNADKIVVIHNGEIFETGSHSELIERDGIYSNLYRLQNEIGSFSAFAD